MKSALKWKYVILLFIGIIIIALDQVTKLAIIQRFRLGETLSIVEPIFNLTYVQNKGAAFGMLSQADPSFRVPFFIIVPCVALMTIIYVFRKIPESGHRLAIALSLVISGAIGNLIDRLRLGFVVDFLDFHWRWTYHFPAFNVADSAICIGVGLILLDLLLQREEIEDGQTAKNKGTTVHASTTH